MFSCIPALATGRCKCIRIADNTIKAEPRATEVNALMKERTTATCHQGTSFYIHLLTMRKYREWQHQLSSQISLAYSKNGVACHKRIMDHISATSSWKTSNGKKTVESVAYFLTGALQNNYVCIILHFSLTSKSRRVEGTIYFGMGYQWCRPIQSWSQGVSKSRKYK